MALVSDIITQTRYPLIDINANQWSDTELLNYLNECCDMIHQTLIDSESELIRTGTTTVTTASGIELYTLPTDLWTIHKVWVETEDPMDMCEESDRYQYLKQEEDSDTSARTTPTDYYIDGGEIGLLPFSDAIYTVNVIYYTTFTDLVSTDEMPYKGLFNSQIRQGVVMLGKNRNELGLNIEGVLMEMYQARALRLTRKRRKKNYQMKPRWRN